MIFNFNTVDIKIANAHQVNSWASFVGTTYAGLQRHLFKDNHKNESHWQPNLDMIQSASPKGDSFDSNTQKLIHYPRVT